MGVPASMYLCMYVPMYRSRVISKEALTHLPTNMQSWECGECDSILLPGAGYVNHLKCHHNNQKQANYINLPHCSADNTTCVIYSKIYRSLSGLRMYMMIHKRVVDPVNPIKPDSYVIECWSQEIF